MTLLETKAATTDPDPPVTGPAPNWRARVFAVCLALVTLSFLQDPGRVVADTKLDLTVDAWGFLGRALHLWDPNGFFGQLQNQAYGYLWPMGPFFGIGQSLGVPDWVVQRLWWSVILVAGFLGIYLLVRALGVGSGWPQILAALAYTLAVRPQSALGAVSVEVWPMAVAPWVLLPLVRAASRGNVARAAALSALAVTMAGGVNAVAAGAVLPLALWWLLTLEPGPRRRQLLAWWSGLTVLAILWWLIPLVVLGKYSPPFLDWIESAQFTTSITDPTTVLRGADHWLAYLGSASAWKAGWMLATYPLFVVLTGIVAAAGVAGLAMRSLPHRAFLVGGAVAGLVLVTAGHAGALSGLGSEQIQVFLDGAGAPLRNVHKFDLVLRIPLVIAFCHLLTSIWPTPGVSRWRLFLAVGLVAALVASWWPAATGQLARGRSYVAVADHWREVAQWLDERARPGRALIVPGAPFGEYTWGRTQDEPLQALGGYPWGIRDAVPLSSAGNIRMLDALETRLETGQGSPGLAQYLERMGVRYLVVRNDLAPTAPAPSPIRVHQALEGSPGIQRVAGFGLSMDPPDAGSTLTEEGTRVGYRAVEIYAVNANNNAPDPRILVRPATQSLSVNGAPEALLALADARALGNRSTVLVGDPRAGELSAAGGVLTDTDRRREITFGYMRSNESPTMTADQPYDQKREVHDYRVVGDEGGATALPGLDLTASSSASDVDATRRQPRGATPAAVMDGALDTYWRPGSITERGSFWQVRYQQAVDLGPTLELALLSRGNRGTAKVPLVISTDNGTTTVDARRNAQWQSLDVAGGPTTFVRVAVPPSAREPTFGIREIRLPGRTVTPVRLPDGATGDALLLTARPGDANECVPSRGLQICSDELGGFSQDRTGLMRQVDLASAITATPRILVAVRDARTITDALNRVSDVSVTASSTRTREVAGSGRAAFDRQLGTAWQAAPDDNEPSLTIQLPASGRLRGIRLVNRPGLNATSPLELRVDVSGRSFTGFTDSRGLFRFSPVVSDRLTVTFLSGNQVRSRAGLTESVLPIGVSEVALIGADDLRQRLPPTTVLALPCGTGPDILVDGVTVSKTSVTARVEQFEAGESLPAQVCAAPVTIPAGEHRVTVRSSPAYRPVSALFATDDFYRFTGRPLSPRVISWRAAQRIVEVAASPRPQVLEMAENFNEGWRAVVGEQELAPTRVDGWKQAFVVPAGSGGEVHIDYRPDGSYRWGLLVGLIAALAVVLVAIRPPRLKTTPARSTREVPRLVSVLVGLGVLFTAGPWGLLAFALALATVRRANLPTVAFVAVLAAVCVAAVAGVRPGSVAAVLQGVALVTMWAAVLWAGWPVPAARVGGQSGSTAGPDAR